MIITKLIGGLGNQMFQYAAGKALSCKYNTVLKIDDSELRKSSEGKYTQRRYELDIFNADIQIARDTDIFPFINKNTSRIKREVQRRAPFLFNTLQAVESGSSYQSEFKHYPKNTLLSGFWQSEMYFKEYENEIKKDFNFKQSVIDSCALLIDVINITNSVSLHVRRGDYVNNTSANKFHGVCSPQYYEEAVSYIASSQKQINLFIFSDDIIWCKENLKFSYPMHFLNTVDAASDLYLMSKCRHNIIANSSFSWWGAWLNQNPSKIVVAPQQWFADSSANSSDIIPASWIKI